ncbi:MAG: Holliday junction resolvase RuvX [Burkholderiales bacterium]
MSGTPEPRTVLAFDYGTRRIGVAVGNTITRTARPLATIDDASDEARMTAVGRLVEEWSPGLLVVGLPVHADGTPHAMTSQAQRFAQELRRRFGAEVRFADERHSSEVANAALAGQGRAGRAKRDQVAAQIILQAWLDDSAHS